MRRTFKTLVVFMGLCGASFALAHGGNQSFMQECIQMCNDIQKPCVDTCRQQVKTADQKQHCAPTCKQAVDACRAECGKQAP